MLPLLTSLLLLGSTACEKEDEEREGLSFVKGIPYYHFTDGDQPWLSARQGDEWKFVNKQGYQRVYQVRQIILDVQAENKEVQPPGLNLSKPELYNYYDQTTVRLTRTDSLRGGGELRFYRGAALRTNLNSGGVDKNTSRFYAKGDWYEFVGNTDIISDYYSCRGLKFPSGAALEGSFTQLTVSGRQYSEVVTFIGTDRGPDCAPVSGSYMQELYYDRRAGMVRMVSKAGEVWDRVP
ncbi:hypothetical protein [uncultured Hymenobacter sp.]|uniref:hypothetical protein n=1 Tax=uncultured Hymenobacter sp. TaxID=170016 RepID=UPI0035CB1974